LGLKGKKDWASYCQSGQKPDDIPADPRGAYKDKGWISWGDWLGTGVVASQNREYRSFESARDYVRGLGLKSWSDWQSYCKSGQKPDDIPADPRGAYKDKGWVSSGDWLGTGTVANQNREYRSFEDARDYVRGLGLKGQADWSAYCKSGQKPDDIPADPRVVYEDKGWVSWGDWLGKGNKHSKNLEYRSFESARDYVRGLGLKTQEEWKSYCKSGQKPDDIPADPRGVYKDKGWVSSGD
jgi:crotonobetainyl-CoA:carnitine CoA-transferase CaiB-like acyl-CoA transferase